MTRKKWDKLSPEELRIKIASFFGCFLRTLNGQTIKTWVDKNGKTIVAPPDYPNDLNAMHEAEKILKDNKPMGVHSQAATYRLCLYRIVERDGGNSVGWGHATAAQRAEAFVLTMEPEEK